MTNVKITDLANYTDATATDVLPIVDVAADVTKRISIGNLVKAVPVGTAAAPAIAFDGNETTGVYSPGANQIAFSTAGVGRLFIDSSGNIGVGTGSPDALFTVNGVGAHGLGSASAPSFAFTGDLNTGIYSPGADQVAISTGGSGRLFIDSSGRVGIGVASPAKDLDISSPSPALRFTDTTDSSYSQIDVYSSDLYISADLGGTDSGQIIFRTNGENERARIDSSGRLGLGTSSPGAKLQVNGDILLGATSDRILTNNIGIVSSSADLSITSGSANLLLKTGASNDERLRIDTSGRVGIGTASVNDTLEVSGSAIIGKTGTANQIRFRRPGDSALTGFLGYTDSANDEKFEVRADGGAANLKLNANNATGFITFDINSSEKARLDSSGRLGLGTSSPSTLLHIQSTDPAFRFKRSDAGTDAYGELTTDISGLVTMKCDPANAAAGSGFRITVDNTERLRIDSSGRLLVGTSSALTGSNSQYSKIVGVGNSANNGAGYFSFAAGSARSNGEDVANLWFTDNGAGEYASIRVFADGTTGSGDYPGRLVFSTTADGASSPTERLKISSSGSFEISNATQLLPITDNAVTLGASGYRYSAVWAANGTIQTSDERTKTDISDAQLGSEFIKSLRPVSYRWVEGGKRDTGERDEDGNYIYESVSGDRTHWGFIAQEVKEAVDVAGVDFGGWVLTDKDDPDSQQALRYDQFIAPLTKALQETMAELEALKAEVAALKGA